LVIAVLAVLASGCEPIATYRYVLKNDTSHPLTATYSTFSFRDSTVVVAAESSRVIYEYQRLGKIKDVQERFELEMKAVSVSYKDSVIYIQEPVQRRFWEIEEKKGAFGGGHASYVLFLNAALLGL